MIPAITGAIGPLGSGEWSIGGIGGLATPSGTQAVTGALTDPNAIAATGGTGSTGSFSDALTQAISGLENTQANATSAAQGLATGTISDPTQAVTAVENAALAMDYASQIRNKLDDAATTIFQTQV